MPTYDYQCVTCNKVTEIFHSIKDSQKRKCPKCGKLTLKRLISGGVGVLFKGDGFYITDSKKTSSTKKKDDTTKDTGTTDSSVSESTTNDTAKKEKKENTTEISKNAKEVKPTSKKNSSSNKV